MDPLSSLFGSFAPNFTGGAQMPGVGTPGPQLSNPAIPSTQAPQQSSGGLQPLPPPINVGAPPGMNMPGSQPAAPAVQTATPQAAGAAKPNGMNYGALIQAAQKMMAPKQMQPLQPMQIPQPIGLLR